MRARCEHEPELLRRGPGYVLYALMDAVVDRYFPVLQGVETELERIEEQIFADVSPRANIEALYALKQKLMVIRHAVEPAARKPGQSVGRRACRALRGHAGVLSRHLRSSAAAQSDDRIRPRHRVDRDLGQPVDDHAAGKRDDEAARSVRGADRRADDDRRHLRHELRLHAGAALALRLRDRSRRHGRASTATSSIACARRSGCKAGKAAHRPTSQLERNSLRTLAD